MSVSIYANDIKQTQVMIKQAGQLVTWRKLVRTPGVQPWKGTVAPTDFQVAIVFLRKGSGFAQAIAGLLKGMEVTTGAPKGLMAFDSRFTPEVTDEVIRGSVSMQISAIDSLNIDGNPILYYVEFQ